jgi:hypothetical protein
MLYRRTPRNPPTLLLRIVAAASAGTVLGIASCGGETQVQGLLPLTEPSDAQVDDGSPLLGAVDSAGLVTNPGDDAAFMGFTYDPDAEVHGVVVHLPEDASEADVVTGLIADAEVQGVAPLPEDAGADAHHIGVMGVVVVPHDGGSTHTCPPLCGVVIGTAINPGH